MTTFGYLSICCNLSMVRPTARDKEVTSVVYHEYLFYFFGDFQWRDMSSFLVRLSHCLWSVELTDCRAVQICLYLFSPPVVRSSKIKYEDRFIQGPPDRHGRRSTGNGGSPAPRGHSGRCWSTWSVRCCNRAKLITSVICTCKEKIYIMVHIFFRRIL